MFIECLDEHFSPPDSPRSDDEHDLTGMGFTIQRGTGVVAEPDWDVDTGSTDAGL